MEIETVPVSFELEFKTVSKSSVPKLVGSLKQLGNWNNLNGINASQTDDERCHWKVEVNLPSGSYPLFVWILKTEGVDFSPELTHCQGVEIGKYGGTIKTTAGQKNVVFIPHQRCRVCLTTNYKLNKHELLRLVGSNDDLGNWLPQNGIVGTKFDDNGNHSLWFDALRGSEVQCKWVIVNESDNTVVKWQEGENRSINIEDGCILLKCNIPWDGISELITCLYEDKIPIKWLPISQQTVNTSLNNMATGDNRNIEEKEQDENLSKTSEDLHSSVNLSSNVTLTDQRDQTFSEKTKSYVVDLHRGNLIPSENADLSSTPILKATEFPQDDPCVHSSNEPSESFSFEQIVNKFQQLDSVMKKDKHIKRKSNKAVRFESKQTKDCPTLTDLKVDNSPRKFNDVGMGECTYIPESYFKMSSSDAAFPTSEIRKKNSDLSNPTLYSFTDHKNESQNCKFSLLNNVENQVFSAEDGTTECQPLSNTTSCSKQPNTGFMKMKIQPVTKTPECIEGIYTRAVNVVKPKQITKSFSMSLKSDSIPDTDCMNDNILRTEDNVSKSQYRSVSVHGLEPSKSKTKESTMIRKRIRSDKSPHVDETRDITHSVSKSDMIRNLTRCHNRNKNVQSVHSSQDDTKCASSEVKVSDGPQDRRVYRCSLRKQCNQTREDGENQTISNLTTHSPYATSFECEISSASKPRSVCRSSLRHRVKFADDTKEHSGYDSDNRTGNTTINLKEDTDETEAERQQFTDPVISVLTRMYNKWMNL